MYNQLMMTCHNVSSFFVFVLSILLRVSVSASLILNLSDSVKNSPTSTWQRQHKREYICGSQDIHSSIENFQRLKDCTVIEGHLQIRLFESETTKVLNELSFPDLLEITDYLIIYRVHLLRSLENLFPNLSVIRGLRLFTKYALIIFENPDLEDLGLKNLMTIDGGAVRIENNPRLCYMFTLDWQHVTSAVPAENRIESNMPYDLCEDRCPTGSALNACGNKYVVTEYGGRVKQPLCWNERHCQIVCPEKCTHRACSQTVLRTLMSPQHSYVTTVTHDVTCCHEECLSGCTGPTSSDCVVCRHVVYKGSCQRRCPPGLFVFLGRRCITEYQCRNMKMLDDSVDSRIQWKMLSNGSCEQECPVGFMENELRRYECVRCEDGKCPKKCVGGRDGMIDSIEAAKRLKDCTVIDGSLEIAIRGTELLELDLVEYLGKIEEVTWYVRVIYSSALHSLSFLKSLRVIRGERLYQGRALFVLDNPNLQEIWQVNENFTIKNGKVFFLDNHKLCVYKIREFLNSSGLTNRTTDLDILPSSNGNQISCNEKSQLKVEVVYVAARCAGIHWQTSMRSSDADSRYWSSWAINYRKVIEDADSTRSMSKETCNADVWKTVDISSSNITLHYELQHLEPFTTYVSYVQAYSAKESGAISPYTYFKTASDEPTRVVNLVSTRDTSSVTVSWDQPLLPHGVITHYVVRWRPQQLLLLRDRFKGSNYCKNKNTQKVDVESTTSPILEDPVNRTAVCNCSAQCCPCTKRLDHRTVIDEDEKQFHEQLLERRILPENVYRRYIYNPVDSMRDSQTGLERTSARSETDKQISRGTVTHRDETHNRSLSSNESLHGMWSPPEWNSVDVRQHKFFKITGLEHFQDYSIEVMACHDSINGSLKLCSKPAILTVRTLSNVSFDTISTSNATVALTSRGETRVEINWAEPVHPNGLILAYEIELIRFDGFSYKPDIVCITRQQYYNSSGRFISDPLQPGNWSYRILTMSLAGNGTWTLYKYFIIPHEQNLNLSALIGTVSFSCIAVILFIFVFCYYITWKKRQLSELFVASRNPNYHPAEGEYYVRDIWEISRADIQLEDPLGQGSFGMVYRGILKTGLEKRIEIRVAVKTVNDKAYSTNRLAILQEAAVMKDLDCKHVVKLYGVVSIGEPCLVIMELMPNGDLRDFFRRRRPDQLDYVGPPPTIEQILLMAAQIADGMVYLTSKGLVHRDLAARNCMVSEDLIVKIGDFGLTRDVITSEYYRKHTTGLLPIRWMAPESLRDGKYMKKSDVWSYGVVLWEMITLAERPYQQLSDDRVLTFIVGGGVLSIPQSCNTLLKDIMLSCWKYQTDDRPTFEEILDVLVPYFNDRFRVDSYYLNQSSEENQKNSGDLLSATGSSTDSQGDSNNHRKTYRFELLNIKNSLITLFKPPLLDAKSLKQKNIDGKKVVEKLDQTLRLKTVKVGQKTKPNTYSPLSDRLPRATMIKCAKVSLSEGGHCGAQLSSDGSMSKTVLKIKGMTYKLMKSGNECVDDKGMRVSRNDESPLSKRLMRSCEGLYESERLPLSLAVTSMSAEEYLIKGLNGVNQLSGVRQISGVTQLSGVTQPRVDVVSGVSGTSRVEGLCGVTQQGVEAVSGVTQQSVEGLSGVTHSRVEGLSEVRQSTVERLRGVTEQGVEGLSGVTQSRVEAVSGITPKRVEDIREVPLLSCLAVETTSSDSQLNSSHDL